MATGTTNSRLTDEDLLRLPPQEIVRKLRRAEAENVKLMMSHGALIKDVNQRMQVIILMNVILVYSSHLLFPNELKTLIIHLRIII